MVAEPADPPRIGPVLRQSGEEAVEERLQRSTLAHGERRESPVERARPPVEDAPEGRLAPASESEPERARVARWPAPDEAAALEAIDDSYGARVGDAQRVAQIVDRSVGAGSDADQCGRGFPTKIEGLRGPRADLVAERETQRAQQVG